MKVYVYKKHIKECRALEYVKEGSWSTPWFFTGENVLASKNNPKRKGWHHWLIAVCNVTDCCGRIAVKSDSILSHIKANP